MAGKVGDLISRKLILLPHSDMKSCPGSIKKIIKKKKLSTQLHQELPKFRFNQNIACTITPSESYNLGLIHQAIHFCIIKGSWWYYCNHQYLCNWVTIYDASWTFNYSIHASSSFHQVLCKPTSLEEMHTDLEMRTEWL